MNESSQTMHNNDGFSYFKLWGDNNNVNLTVDVLGAIFLGLLALLLLIAWWQSQKRYHKLVQKLVER